MKQSLHLTKLASEIDKRKEKESNVEEMAQKFWLD